MNLFKSAVKIKSRNPRKAESAKESPITIKVSFLVSAKVGQLICLNSCRDSSKKDLIFENMKYDTNIRIGTNDTDNTNPN